MSEDTATETPQHPAFPYTQYGIMPNGMQIQAMLAEGMALTFFINEEGMNAIAGKWLETRREIKQQMEDAQRVVQNDTANAPVSLERKRKAK